MVVKDTKIYKKMKNKSSLSKKKIYIYILYNEKKHLIIIIRNYFYLENLFFS